MLPHLQEPTRMYLPIRTLPITLDAGQVQESAPLVLRSAALQELGTNTMRTIRSMVYRAGWMMTIYI